MANVSNYGLIGVGSTVQFSKGGNKIVNNTGTSFNFKKTDGSTDVAITAAGITSSAGNVTLTGGNLVVQTDAGQIQLGATSDTIISRYAPGVVEFNGTAAIVLPSGPTGDRPTPTPGMFRYNGSTFTLEYYDGTTWQTLSYAAGAVSSFQTSLSGLTPSTATTGAVTLAGTLGAASGGTGFSSYTAGDILYASGATTLVKLPAGSATQVLHSGTTPSWSAVSLTADVTGILPAANGGTGVNNSFTITLGGNISTGGAFTTTPGNAVTLTTTGTTNVTLPTSGTLLTTADTSNYVASVQGTTNQIAANTVFTTQTGAVTLTIPSTFIAPGTIKSTTTTEVGTNLTVDGFVFESSAVVAAAGNTGGTAFQLTKQYNVITSATGGSAYGVALPDAVTGLEITLVNFTNVDVLVYPFQDATDNIDAAGAGNPVSLPSKATASYQCVNAEQWYTVNPALTTTGSGLGIAFGNGVTTITNTGVTAVSSTLSGVSFSGSTGSVTLSGTLGVLSGGTGASTLTNHGVVIGQGVSPVHITSAGTQYQVLNSSGSSADPIFDAVHLDQSAAVTGILPLTNGGTNANLTAVAGAPVYSTGSALAIGTAGTSGQAYISGGSGAPTWQNVASTLTTNQILEGNGSGAFTANGATFVGSGTFSGVTLSGTVYNPTDAATKAYVDAATAGLNVHASCETTTVSVVTDPQFATAVYNHVVQAAPGGVGDTLTAATNLDINDAGVGGYSGLQVGSRVLVNCYTISTTPTYVANGIYVVTTIGVTGGGGTPWVLTRASDYNNSTPGQVMAGDFTFVTEGTSHGTGWVETAIGTYSTPPQPVDTININTDPIYFTQFSGAGSYTAGAGLTLTSGTQFNVKFDNSTIYIDGSNQVAVKSSGTADQVLLSNGSSTTPSWGALPLGNSSAVSGQLTVPNGGTGQSSFTLDGVLYGNAGSGLLVTAAGSTGDVLVGNTGSAPSFAALSGIAVTSIAGTTNEITASASTGSVTLSLPSTVVLPGSLEVTTTSKFDGLMYESTGAVTAAGATQGTATALTKQFSVVTSTGSGQGVILPTAAAGLEIEIVVIGSNSVNVYPATGANIDAAATNVAIVVPAGATWTGEASSSTQWYSIDPAIVNGSGISVTYLAGQTSVANTGVLSFSTGSSGLTVNASTGSVSINGGQLTVGYGGTGASTLTAHAVLIGNGTSAVNFAGPGTTNFALVSTGGSSDPTFQAIVNSVTGTSNQIDISSSTGTPTFTLSSTLVAPGTVEVTTSLKLDNTSANEVLTTNGSNVVVGTALTNGQLLIGSSGAAPVAGTLTAGSGITITNGAGSITIASTAGSGAIASVQATFNFTATSPVTIGTIPAGATIVQVKMFVGTVDTGSALVSVGDVSNGASSYMATSENDPQITGIYVAEAWTPVGGSPVTAIATITGFPASGSCTVIVEYAV